MLVTLITVAEVLYVLALSAVIILEKRPPLATLAWILSLAALPLLGFVIFYFLGPKRLERRRSKRTKAAMRVRAAFAEGTALFDPERKALRDAIDPRERQLMALALNGSEAAPTAGNRLEVLRNGAKTFDAIEAAIRGAKRNVHLEYYIFHPDGTGARIRDALVERARAGVRVRLLVDAVGSLELDDAFLDPLLRAGGEFATFNPVSFARFRPAWNFRNHRKIVVIDGETGFLGGINIGDEYASLDREAGPWRDTHLKLQGPAVRALQLHFLEDWSFSTGRSPSVAECFPDTAPPGDAKVQILASGPDREWEPIRQAFFAAISGAQSQVHVTTPYFVPDDALLTALCTASLRGVDVTLLTPRRIDSALVLAAGRSNYETLLRAGVRVYEYLPGPLHAKVLTVDGTLAIAGTSNFDERSFRLNFEVDAIVYDAATTRELDGQFEQDLTLSREITAEGRAELTFVARFAEAGARLFSPLL